MKVFIAGLTIAAAVVGGGIGYASLQTGIAPPVWENAKWESAKTEQEELEGATESSVNRSADKESANSPTRETATEAARSETARSETERQSSSADRPVVIAEPDDIVISEAELNQRIQEALASDPTIAPLLDITEDGVNTIITNDRIESGITMNLTELPLEDLPPEAQTAVSEMVKTFPFLANRPVYLGIEGNPKIVDGAVSLDDTNVKFGPLKLPVSGVASQLGVSQNDIEQQLNVVLEQQGLTPEEIQIIDKQIIIKGI